MHEIAIVEDDEKSAYLLQQYIQRMSEDVFGEYAVDLYESGINFIENYAGKYDSVIIDFGMSDLSGMSIARKMREEGNRCCIIFVSDTDENAVQGYDVEASAFLVKPVKYSALVQAMKRAVYKAQEYYAKALPVIIKDNQGIKVLASSDIEYIEIAHHELNYHMKGGQVYAQRGTLKVLEELLQKVDFCRCNNCYLVNLRCVTSIDGNIVTVGSAQLQISRPKKKEFLENLLRYESNRSKRI